MAAQKGKRSKETRKKISEKAKQRWANMTKEEKAKITAHGRRTAKDKYEETAIIRWDEFLKVFEANKGMITKACKAFGCSTADVYRRMNKDQDFKQKYEEIRNAKILEVEDSLLKQIDKGDTQAIKYYLQCQSKNWIPQTKVQADVNANIKILNIDPIE